MESMQPEHKLEKLETEGLTVEEKAVVSSEDNAEEKEAVVQEKPMVEEAPVKKVIEEAEGHAAARMKKELTPACTEEAEAVAVPKFETKTGKYGARRTGSC